MVAPLTKTAGSTSATRASSPASGTDLPAVTQRKPVVAMCPDHHRLLMAILPRWRASRRSLWDNSKGRARSLDQRLARPLPTIFRSPRARTASSPKAPRPRLANAINWSLPLPSLRRLAGNPQGSSILARTRRQSSRAARLPRVPCGRHRRRIRRAINIREAPVVPKSGFPR